MHKTTLMFIALLSIISCVPGARYPDATPNRNTDLKTYSVSPKEPSAQRYGRPAVKVTIDRDIDLKSISEINSFIIKNAYVYGSQNPEFTLVVGHDYLLAKADEAAFENISNPGYLDFCNYIKALPVIDKQAVIDMKDMERLPITVLWSFAGILAKVLEEGNCRVLDQTTDKEITQIRAGNWISAHSCGRVFQARDGRNILKVIDILSYQLA